MGRAIPEDLVATLAANAVAHGSMTLYLREARRLRSREEASPVGIEGEVDDANWALSFALSENPFAFVRQL
jgi:hypothetical protein